MILEQAKELLREAARPTLAEIRRDLSGAPEKLAPLLGYLSQELFDPDLNVNRLKIACGIRDNSISIVFHEHLGKTPHNYISRARLATAERLLHHPELKVWEIAEMVGYAGLSAFARAFDRYYGKRPRAYRQALGLPKAKKARRAIRATEPAQSPESSIEAKSLRQAQNGILSSVLPVLTQLENLYPRQREEAPPEGIHAFERLMAEKIWRQIRALPMECQQEALVSRHTFRSTALFDLLREESRKEGLRSRQGGIFVSRLALASVDSTVLPRTQTLQLKARAWAWVANAERLADDLLTAERSLAQADRHLAATPSRDPFVDAELHLVKASLRAAQSLIHEALEATDYAEACARESGDKILLARALTLRGRVHWLLENHHDAVRDLETASLVAGQQGSSLQISIASSLTMAYISTGKLEKAYEPLEQAKLGVERLKSPAWQLQMNWVEGLLHSKLGQFALAESYYRKAYEGFGLLGETTNASNVGLDLSLMLLTLGKNDEALRIAGQIFPLFEQLQLPRNSAAALGVLQRALEKKQLSEQVLEPLREALPGLGFSR